MFRLLRPSHEEKQKLLASAREASVSSPALLTIAEGFLGDAPHGFSHDSSRSELGQGLQAFKTARDAFLRWQQFDLGWVRVVDASVPILPGQLVGVEAHTAGLWTVNLSRIMEVVDSATCFGFLYATTALHVEQGQESFVLSLDPVTESVSYVIEAVSRPRHLLARVGYPFTRAMQHRFAGDSHARMRRQI